MIINISITYIPDCKVLAEDIGSVHVTKLHDTYNEWGLNMNMSKLSTKRKSESWYLIDLYKYNVNIKKKRSRSSNILDL